MWLTEALRKILLRILSTDMRDATLRQLTVLVCLRDRAGTVRDIAAETKMGKPVVSRTADRLEAIGFAERRDDPHDRRSVLLVLTPVGKQFLTSVTNV